MRPDQAALDLPAILKRLGGDEELLHELAGVFLDVLPEQLAGVRTAVARGSASSLRKAAHRLRGSMASFELETATNVLTALEQCGTRPGGVADAPCLLGALEVELAWIVPAMEALAESGMTGTPSGSSNP